MTHIVISGPEYRPDKNGTPKKSWLVESHDFENLIKNAAEYTSLSQARSSAKRIAASIRGNVDIIDNAAQDFPCIREILCQFKNIECISETHYCLKTCACFPKGMTGETACKFERFVS